MSRGAQDVGEVSRGRKPLATCNGAGASLQVGSGVQAQEWCTDLQLPQKLQLNFRTNHIPPSLRSPPRRAHSRTCSGAKVTFLGGTGLG